MREELRGPYDIRRQCSSYFDAATIDLFGVAGPLSRQPGLRRGYTAHSNGHNAVIVLQLEIRWTKLP